MRAFIIVVIGTMAFSLAHGGLLAQTSVQEPSQDNWLRSIRMFDTQNGWAESYQGYGGVSAKGAERSVVHTTDGGIHWKDVTPLRPIWWTGWISPLSAWVTATRDPPPSEKTPNRVIVLFHTMDGGQTWKSVTVPFVGIIDFINARDGWLRVGRGDVGGDIYRTTNGGETWGKVGSARSAGQVGSLVMTFLNVTTGWIAGECSARDGICLLVTRDGGRTWQQQKLSSPQQTSLSPAYLTPPPRFFGPRDGVLSQPHAFHFVTYVTRDGGTSWMHTTPVRLHDYYRGSSFADVNHGWVTDGVALYVTTNGGRHWNTVRPGPPFEHVYELSFVSPRIGWASGQPLWPPLLLKTVDGGHTWASVAYTVVRK